MNHLFLYVTNMEILKKMLHTFIEECEHVSALHFNRGSKHTMASGISRDMNILQLDLFSTKLINTNLLLNRSMIKARKVHSI